MLQQNIENTDHLLYTIKKISGVFQAIFIVSPQILFFNY